MGGTWPNLDLSDLTARSRTYLNEAVAKFYPDAEIYRNLSYGAKKIAQEGSAVRRPLDAVTVSGTRTVATNCYNVMFVEYVPATGRSFMLRKIEPHQVGLKALKGTAPQYWYEFGATIGIEPLPDAVYKLRLYVSDIPRLQVLSFASFTIGVGATQWTASTGGWTGGSTAVHVGAASVLAYNTALVDYSNYLCMLTVSGVGTGGKLTIYDGYFTINNTPITTNGLHTVRLSQDFASTYLCISAENAITLDDLYVYREADFSAVTDQTDIPPMWQHLISLIATSEGLKRDNRNGPAQIIEALTVGEIAYLRSNILEIIPTSRNERRAD